MATPSKVYVMCYIPTVLVLWPFLITCAMLLQDERDCAEDQAVCQSPHCHRWVYHTLVIMVPLPPYPHTHTLLLSSYTCYHRDTPQLWGHSTQTSTVCSQENIQSELLLFWILALSFISICACSLHTPPLLKYIALKLDTFVETHLEFGRSHCKTEHSVALGSSIIWQAYILQIYLIITGEIVPFLTNPIAIHTSHTPHTLYTPHTLTPLTPLTLPHSSHTSHTLTGWRGPGVGVCLQPRSQCPHLSGQRQWSDLPAIHPQGPGGAGCVCGWYARPHSMQRDDTVALQAHRVQGSYR